MLKRMQNNPKVELQMHEANLPELRDVHKVDERLVVLAKALGARVVTNDFNLNKIAQLQGVEVINLNELANALKSVALPGEILTVRLVKPGDQIGQGVGYLDDGTMVVVEQGRSHDRPGSDDHRHQRAADAGRPDDLRPDRRPAAAPPAADGRVATGAAALSIAGRDRGRRIGRRRGCPCGRCCRVALAGRPAGRSPRQAPRPAPPSPRPRPAPRDVELVETPARRPPRLPDRLEQLRAHYITAGDIERARWAEEELLQYHRIPKQAFRLELDVPPPTLQADTNIPEANELYRRAMTYKDKGWGTDYIDNQRRAELLLQQLLTQATRRATRSATPPTSSATSTRARPTSSTAGRPQYLRALLPVEPDDAVRRPRLRAARLYDRQLIERKRAAELYQDVTTHETDPKRMQEAQKH